MSLFEVIALHVYKDSEFQKPIRHYALNRLQEEPPLDKDEDEARFFHACVAAMRQEGLWISELAEPLFGAVAELLDIQLTITQYDEAEGRLRHTTYGNEGTPLHLLRVQENRFTLVEEACSLSPRS